MKHTRESNIELLRIVAMLMITFGHYIIHGLWHSSFSGGQQLNQPGWLYVQNLVFSMCVVGVNLFVLISGFFKIKLTWGRVVAYVLMCITYNLMGWLSHSVVSGVYDLQKFFTSLIVTKTTNWFFRSYWWLLLVSPIINRAFEHFSIKETRMTVGLLTVLNCISGFLFCYENSTGYGPAHMIYIYIIGTWLKKESENENVARIPWKGTLSVYLLLSVLTSAFAAFSQIHPFVNVSKIYAYNNPVIIASSIALFLTFRSIKIESGFINEVASSVIGVLFLQEGVLLPWTYTFIRRKYEIVGDGLMIMAWICAVLAMLWIAGCVTEYIRKWMTKPVSKKIALLFDRVIPLFE